jgi:hypothetical protein
MMSEAIVLEVQDVVLVIGEDKETTTTEENDNG